MDIVLPLTLSYLYRIYINKYVIESITIDM